MSELVLEENNILPKGWTLGRIQDIVLNPKNDIVDGPFGSNLKATEYVDHGVPIIRLQNVSRHQFINKNIRYVTKEKAEQLKRHSFLKNDIVMTKLGYPVGKASLVPEFLESGIIVADILRMRVADKFISRKFVLYVINSDFIIKQFAYHTQGTTRPRVNLTKFRDFLIPIPPLNEQKRIVEKIEEMFSLVDSTKEMLEKTKILLKQYRQSILKFVFEGKIVPQDPNDESIDILLEKIRCEKPNNQSMSESVLKDPKQFPKGWGILDFPDVVFFQEGPGLRSFQFTNTGMKVVNVTNIVDGHLDLSNTSKHISMDEFTKKYTHFAVEDKDILMASSGATYGKTAFATADNLPLVMNTSVIRLHPKHSIYLDRQFLNYFLQTEFFKTQIRKFVTGSAQPNFGPTHLMKTKILVAPLNEQKRIVEKIEESIYLIQNSERQVDSLLLQNNSMKKSILKQAFEGKLVPQDPNDEPASELLKQIKQEKQQLIQKQKTSRRSKNVK